MNLYKVTGNVGEDTVYGHILCVWYVRANDPTAAQERVVEQELLTVRAVTSIELMTAYLD